MTQVECLAFPNASSGHGVELLYLYIHVYTIDIHVYTIVAHCNINLQGTLAVSDNSASVNVTLLVKSEELFNILKYAHLLPLSLVKFSSIWFSLAVEEDV